MKEETWWVLGWIWYSFKRKIDFIKFLGHTYKRLPMLFEAYLREADERDRIKHYAATIDKGVVVEEKKQNRWANHSEEKKADEIKAKFMKNFDKAKTSDIIEMEHTLNDKFNITQKVNNV